MNSELSAEIRAQLERYLCHLFQTKAINRYLHFAVCDTALPISDRDMPALPQLKQAYAIWSAMSTGDRHRVLDKFRQLYAGADLQRHYSNNTMVFCAVFVHELSSLLQRQPYIVAPDDIQQKQIQ